MMKYLVILLVISFDFGFCTIVNHRNSVNDPSSITYYTKPNNGLTIPIMIHLDKALISKLPKHKTENKYMRRERFKKITRIFLKDVEKIFKHPTLNQTVRLVLLDVKILKNKLGNVVMDENVSKYLNTYCEWQGEKKVVKRRWYYSILLTGLDLYYVNAFNQKIRSSTGRGYMRGICSVRNSCTLLKWHPKNIAYILAHELAHSAHGYVLVRGGRDVWNGQSPDCLSQLGLTISLDSASDYSHPATTDATLALGVAHDGPPHNECRGQRYIMNAKYSPSNPAINWSPCSKRSLHQYLKSDKAWCLHPERRNMILL